MTRLFDIELSGLVFHKDDPALIRDMVSKPKDREKAYKTRYDFRTFIYDCFFAPQDNEVVLVCPSLMNFHKLFDELTFSIDGKILSPKSVDDISRGSLVVFESPSASPNVMTVTHPLFGGNLVIGSSFRAEFKDTNVIYSISQNNRLEWIQDWLSYYVKAHGANAVVLSDNESTNYTPDELANAIREVPGIEKAAIIRSRYPFGPSGTKSYESLFLQRSLAEICRRRFLGTARAVLSVDIDEFVYSFSGQSIFDGTVESEQGYIRIDAEWVYAAEAKHGKFFRHSDHAFISENGKPKTNRKWCVDPKGPLEDRQWLTHFIGPRSDPVDPDFRLWHFRQISDSWKFDRKTNIGISLKPAKDLQRVMQQVFPANRAVPLENSAPTGKSNLIITAMKNEGPFILEWIAYHRVIGFTDFLVYTNDCSDGTDAILDRLQEMGIVKHERNNVLRRGPQKSALKYAMAHELSKKADWILVSDIDEFLNIKIGDGQLNDLLNAVPDADVIPVTWRLFSNDNIQEFNDEIVIEAFTDAQLDIEQGGVGKRFVKSLFRRNADVQRFGTHGPIFSAEKMPGISWLAPDNTRITDPKQLTRPSENFVYEIAQFNHYATRSVDSFLVKKDRGRVNHFKQIMELDYWQKMCLGGAKDTSISRHIDATKKEIETLRKDNVLAALHDQSVAWYHQKIAALRQQSEYEEMRDSILGL